MGSGGQYSGINYKRRSASARTFRKIGIENLTASLELLAADGPIVVLIFGGQHCCEGTAFHRGKERKLIQQATLTVSKNRKIASKMTRLEYTASNKAPL
jgi:hypothetical protein